MGVKGGVPKTVTIDGREFPMPVVKRRFFGWKWYGTKLYARIGRLIIEAGWYSGEPPCIEVKAFEWFADCGEVVLVKAQAAKAILCVSWDWGRR